MRSHYHTAAALAVSVTCVLGISLYTDQTSRAQTVQQRQTDLDFNTRLAAQADSLQRQVADLDVRVRNLNHSSAPQQHAAASVQVQPAATTPSITATGATPTAEDRVPERLRHKERSANTADLDAISGQLKMLDEQILAEKIRLDSSSRNQGSEISSAEQNLQKLQLQIQTLDKEVTEIEKSAR